MTDAMLSKDVFICSVGTQLVMLDLRRDEYSSLDRAQAKLLAGRVPGWPVSADLSDSVPGGEEEVRSLLKSLVEDGVLTVDPAKGKSADPVSPERATAVLNVSEAVDIAWVPRLWFLQLCVDFFVCHYLVRFRPMHKIFGTLRRSGPSQSPMCCPELQERLRCAVALYFRARPYLFGANNRCLFDSLLLMRFVRRFDVYPNWMFGVQSEPFSAHCWVQLGQTLLNDSLERTQAYTPILAV